MAARLRTTCAVKLLLPLLLLALPAVVQAQEFTYTTQNGQITITGYTGLGGAVTIPSTIDGLPVINIRDRAFEYCSSLTNVTIGNSVTSIGVWAFGSCTSLTSVTIGNNVTSIGDYAFAGCTSLTSVTVGNGVTSIGQGAFADCNSLNGVTLPKSVTSIGNYAFADCTSLSTITVNASNSVYSSVGGVLFDKSQTTIIEYPGGKTGSYTIPTSVTSIGEVAFFECTNLTSVTIGNTVTSIWNGAFGYCSSMTGVTIPNSVTFIGDAAFEFCTGLTSVSIPASVTSIEGGVFANCNSLTNVMIGNSVIGDQAFSDCTSLTSVTIPASVTNIGAQAFSDCTNLTGVYFKGNAPSVGDLFVFFGDNNATVYYLPGTTGWPTVPDPWAGRPTALWAVTLTVSPSTTTAYGSLLVGNTRNLAFTVANVGTAAISGTTSVAAPFSIVSGGSYTLPPGQSNTTTVQYAPAMAGNNIATVTFTGGSGATLMLTGSAYTDPTPTTGAMAGQVTRASDNSPVNGVSISVIGPRADPQSPQAVTGANGGFEVSGLRPNAHYSVTAMPPNLGLLNMVTMNDVTVVSGQTTTVNIALPSCTGNQPPAPTAQNTPVLLVRGYGPPTEWADDDEQSWKEMRTALEAAGFTVWDPNEPEARILAGVGHVINGAFGIEDNVGRLLPYIQEKAVQYEANHGGYYPPQIHIVAHSMGGLFTRGALGNNDRFTFTNPSFTLKVGKIIMLAPPNCGSRVADFARNELLKSATLCDALAGFADPRWDSTRDLTTSSMQSYNSTHPWPSVPLYLLSASDSDYAIKDGILNWKDWNERPDPCPVLGPIILDENVLNGTSGTDEDINDGLATKPSVNGIFWTSSANGAVWVTGFPQQPVLHQVKSVTFSPVLTCVTCVGNPVQSITDSELGRSLDHFCLLKDSAVIGWVVNTLLNPNVTPTLKPDGTPYTTTFSAKAHGAVPLDGGGAGPPGIPLQPLESVVGSVTNGATLAVPVIADARTTLTFQLMASDTNIILRLNDSSGALIDATTPQTNTNVQYTASAMASNLLLATLTIANPTGGVWTAVIDGSRMITTQAAYSLMIFGDSYVGLIPQTASLFAPGLDAVQSCLLADLSTNPVVAVANASITARILLPDGTTNSLTLFDDGWHNDGAPNDGVYAAVLAKVQQAGTYSIAYRATGTNAQGQAFQRVATGGFSVSSGHATLLGDLVYEKLDIDGDGIADFLEVKCWVNPTAGGNYIFAGDLVDASGTNRFSESAAFAADGSGPTMATLIFNLALIRATGGSGDFHIENLQLFEQTSSGTAWLDTYQGSLVVNIQGAKAINIGVWTNQFGFTITGSSNLVIMVDACTNLTSPIWSSVGTNTLTGGSSYFSDPEWTNHPVRFYRLRSP